MALEQLPFSVDFLKRADPFDPFVPEAPLEYSSPNAPRVTDALGRLLLSVASGHPDGLNRAIPVEGIRGASPRRSTPARSCGRRSAR